MRLRVPASPPAAAGRRRRPWWLAVEGLLPPVVIAAAVLVVLHRVAFGGEIWNHPDVLPYFLPHHCFLGDSLASGHVPAWNPHTLVGVPFAADPQSGWMNVPAMLLYTVLPCGAALRWFIVLHPILGGVALYSFLRTEGLSRAAAMVGGLALALPIASSRLAHIVWMSQALAWTAVGLAAASRMFRARAWSGRLAWAVAAALAMGQVAAAHLSNGLAIGLLILSSYVVARAVVEVRAGRRWSQVAALLAVLAALGILANLAVLLPRLTYLPRTTLGLGYRALEELRASARGGPAIGKSATPTVALRFALAPGLYLGAIPLGLSVGGFLARRRLALAGAFAFSGAVSYLLSQRAVALAADSVEGWDPVLGAYTREPFRFVYAMVPAIAVLGALGVQAWQEAERPARRLLVAAPGFAVWGILPLAFDGRPEYHVAFALGAAAGAVVLGISAVDRRLAPFVALVLAVELTAAGWIGHTAELPPQAEVTIAPLLHPVESSTVDLDEYLAPGPIVAALGERPGDRFMSLAPGRFRPRGYQRFREPADWGLMATVRAPLFALEEAQGYNPVQPIRLWRFVREAEPRARRSNQSFFVRPAPAVFDLLDVSSIITGAGQPAPVALRGRPIVSEDGWVLVDLPSNPPRASFPTSWSVVPSLDEALDAVTERGFDPAATVVLEASPSPAPAATTGLWGTATYRATGPQRAEIDVETPTGGVLLVRNSFDPNWHATVDDEPTPVLPGNGFLQAVAVPPGRHRVVLSYDDPTIGLGVLGSLATTALTLGGALVLRRRERRRGMTRGGAGPEDDPGPRPPPDLEGAEPAGGSEGRC